MMKEQMTRICNFVNPLFNFLNTLFIIPTLREADSLRKC
jgi:hypothetical protein